MQAANYGAKGNSSGKVKIKPLRSSGHSTTLTCVVTSQCATYELKRRKRAHQRKYAEKTPHRYLCSKMGHPQNERRMAECCPCERCKIGYGINWIAMRYSDILLMYAEVMNELYGADAANPLGGTAMTARTALTEVHSRASTTKPMHKRM